MILIVNADPPDQVEYALHPDDAMFASHLVGLSNKTGQVLVTGKKRRCGKLRPTFWAYRRPLGVYLRLQFVRRKVRNPTSASDTGSWFLCGYNLSDVRSLS